MWVYKDLVSVPVYVRMCGGMRRCLCVVEIAWVCGEMKHQMAVEMVPPPKKMDIDHH